MSGVTTALDDAPAPAAVWLKWLAVAVAVIVLDQASKLWVLDLFALGESRPVTGFFNLVLVYNPGAAFSFLAAAGGWQRWFFVVLAAAVSLWMGTMLRRHAGQPGHRGLCWGLTLVMGGAIGNVIDRFAYGAVVDFLDVHAFGWHWPAFNLADSAICLGVALLAWHELRQGKGEKPDGRGQS